MSYWTAADAPTPSLDSDETDTDTSSLITLPGSLRQALYRIEKGHRHQALNDEYKWPCDQNHARFELLQAKILEMTYDNGLYWEPTRGRMAHLLHEGALAGEGQGGRVLDVGSGVTASWATSMAEAFPASEVIGVDLVPSELDYLPQNLTIEIYDLLEGLPYPDEYFSVIHARMLMSSLLCGSSHTFLNELSRCLRPGGLLLLEEPETMVHSSLPVSPNPMLDAIRVRHRFHADHWIAGDVDKRKLSTWATYMGAAVRETNGFRDVDGATVIDACQTFTFGSKPNSGPVASQRGSLVREIWLLAWILNSERQEDAEQLRIEDETYIPEQDVGLYFNQRVVWAEKGQEEERT